MLYMILHCVNFLVEMSFEKIRWKVRLMKKETIVNLKSFFFHFHFLKTSVNQIISFRISWKRVKAKAFTFHFSDNN